VKPGGFLLLVFLVLPTFVLAQNTVVVNADLGETVISKHIYGQFAEHLGRGIYEGVWVGEDSDIPNTEGYRTDVLEALQALEVPNVRWPGGCFADEYDWQDGIGPRADRPKRINTHWGQVIEDNSFGTHEFLRFAELINAEPYISANMGSGTPAQMQDWIEYMTSDSQSTLADMRRANGREEPWKIRFFGIGNESWGCGGHMTAEYYSDLYRQFSTYTKNYSGNRLYKIASGFQNDEYDWTETLMREIGNRMHALSLHYYTVAGDDGWNDKGPSTDFGLDWYFGGIHAAYRMDTWITNHSTRMDKYDPEKRVALAVDEWGIWTWSLEGTNNGFLEQQNSMRDALVAAISLDIMNSHADRVRIANIAQMVNVLQAMIRTDGEQMILTPTYHVFHMYKVHHDATLLPMHLSSNTWTFEEEGTERSDAGAPVTSISATASEKDGVINLTISNSHPESSEQVVLDFRGKEVTSIVKGSARLLTAEGFKTINTFDEPNAVVPTAYTGAQLAKGHLNLELPPHSIVVLQLK
jgi:alpha-N-arabinofuranosidase